MHTRTKFSWQFMVLALSACHGTHSANSAHKVSVEFDAHWNSGKAELARYELSQARYGQIHKGEMVLITVTEPFRTDKQVKAETSEGMRSAINVLKVQQMRRFATGIYDYALTTTSFTALTSDMPQTLKITSSAVDWCGQAWLQLNLRDHAFKVESRSYFEDPGDSNFSIPIALSEDEIWQYIRINPTLLPTGVVSVIPSLMSSRLRHRKLNYEKAQARLERFARLKQSEYSLLYAAGQNDERRVVFVFESEFPHRILEYKESYDDAIGANGKKTKLTTTARLKKAILSAYWREHNLEHNKNRKEFGVRGFD